MLTYSVPVEPGRSIIFYAMVSDRRTWTALVVGCAISGNWQKGDVTQITLHIFAALA